ncbi:MAG: ABC transporter permease subunit [Gammaproteobacteria bacterium]|nr:ABC transporter permease subunit [Gammaproteobacteria bacterium]
MTAEKSTLVANDKRRQWRTMKDRLAHWSVTTGGIGVIVAIMLIFFYLLYVVMPLFESASVEKGEDYSLVPAESKVLALSMEEQGVVGLRYQANGEAVFFRADSGQAIQATVLNGDVPVTAEGVSSLADNGRVLGFSDGRVLFVDAEYAISYPDNQRTITPSLVFPLGEEPIKVADQPIRAVAGRVGDDAARVISLLDDGSLVLTEIELETNFLTGQTSVAGIIQEPIDISLRGGEDPQFLLFDPQQEWIYLTGRSGDTAVLRRRGGEVALNERLSLTDKDEKVSALRLLTGGISLMVGTNRGQVHQYFPVREEGINYKLQRIRSFEAAESPVITIEPEQRRKGFITGHADGSFGVYYTTSHRELLRADSSEHPLQAIAISPRSDKLMLLDDSGRLQKAVLHNEHPEISWSALWGKVWYESYPEPDYVWQSSSASNDFEPKFSLVPLSFGTLKAAFYAMLIAMPLAIMGAIYTAYFMQPKMRTLVKPTVEVMEALPTVILGFLAGLWLAPLMEAHLPGVVILLISLPVVMILCGFAWTRLPMHLRHKVPMGWEAGLLLVPVLLTGWFSFALSSPIEAMFFDGNMPQWITNELGISFDQRNALVVGLAMGFAVIPTIFSIAEDAVFGVPKHLSYGSLALGATPWQTLVHVVLPTASPGIFSGVMIGLGRAVGETMIVLMATGNTPVLDLNIFQGMRTLSANIAVEMPESEVGSSHYRVLFLAALVLFIFTFVFNTAAELIRQRLRNKYSAI